MYSLINTLKKEMNKIYRYANEKWESINVTVMLKEVSSSFMRMALFEELVDGLLITNSDCGDIKVKETVDF